MKLGTETFSDGTKIDIEVTSGGEFRAEFMDNAYDAPTRKELLEKLEKAVKKAQTQRAVDVTILDLQPRDTTKKTSGWCDDRGPYEHGRGAVHASLRAKHGRQWNTWLLADDDGKKFQVSGRNAGIICRRLTSDEVAEYVRLAKAVDDADEAFAAFRNRVEIEPARALEDRK